MSTHLSTAYANTVCTVTLHPPEGKPPTLDLAVMDAFDHVLTEIDGRASALSAVVLQSASPKFFCAGANIHGLESMNRDTVGPWVERGHRLMNRIEALPVPMVARVEGYALGGGLELAMACDLIFASTHAKFGQTETKLGFVTGWGGSYRLVQRVGLARAKELAFTGRIFDAEEAVRVGNGVEYGLAAAVWTRDIGKAHRIAKALRAGMVYVNCYDADDITVPFGGFKQSGNGRDKSLHAMDKYTELKTTWIDLS